MAENQKYLTVSEAVQLSGKPEVTIRRLIKRLSCDSQTQSFVTVTDSNNPKSCYSISQDYLIKIYNIRSNQDDSQVTVIDQSNDESLTVTQQFIDSLLEQLEVKDEQLKNRNIEVAKLHDLLENQQKMTLHGQVQIEKTHLLLLEKNKDRKKVFGLF